MAPAAIFDLVVLSAIAIGIFSLARRTRRSSPQAGAASPALPQTATGPPARERRGGSTVLPVAGIALLVAAAAIMTLVIASQLGAFDPVIDSPSRSELIGVWKASDGATLTLAADGTFRARDLPTGIGDWSAGITPSSGGGRWHVGRFDASTPVGAIFSFPNGSETELQVEHDGPSLAMFYDLGDPDEGWSGQYRFVRQ
jgi:hypothetical protein